jgi:hypothetical protein
MNGMSRRILKNSIFSLPENGIFGARSPVRVAQVNRSQKLPRY